MAKAAGLQRKGAEGERDAERSGAQGRSLQLGPLKGHRELGVTVTASATPGWQGSQEQKQGDLFAGICLWPLGL